MRLLVIRHAIAMERKDYHLQARREARLGGAGTEFETNDDFRPLTQDGQRKMRKNAKGLKEFVPQPHLLVTSPLTRALQTSEILSEVWNGLDMASCDELRPGSEPAEFAKWLKGQPQAEKPDCLIAIVGHEPHLSSLVSWFMTGSSKSLFELKKGGACCLDFARGFDKGRGRLLWLATPPMLRALR